MVIRFEKFFQEIIQRFQTRRMKDPSSSTRLIMVICQVWKQENKTMEVQNFVKASQQRHLSN